MHGTTNIKEYECLLNITAEHFLQNLEYILSAVAVHNSNQ